eukprot:4414432-Amphidinium_carterae.1
METGGKVQQEEFWQQFTPVLHRRCSVLRPAGELTPLQSFCDKLVSGDVTAAVAAAKDANLWPHCLVVAQLVSPASYDKMLLLMHTALTKRQEVGTVGASLSDREHEDPFVQALLLMYSALAKGGVPDFPEEALLHWPAYLAMSSALMRKSDYRALFPGFLDALASALASGGDLFGAHLCYLLSGERSLEALDAPSSLVAMFGVEHRNPENFGC